MNYGSADNALMSVEYDTRLRPASYQTASSVVAGGYVQKYSFTYYADSRPEKLTNHVTGNIKGLSRDFDYDHQGRLSQNVFDEIDVPPVYPYMQGIEYNAFSNMTRRYSYVWGVDNFQEFEKTYINNRQQSDADEAVTYDNAGNVTLVNYTRR